MTINDKKQRVLERVKEIKPCPYINSYAADNADVSFVLQECDNYSDFILFDNGKPSRCFRFAAMLDAVEVIRHQDAEIKRLREALERVSNANDVFMDSAGIDPWGHIQAIDDMAQQALAETANPTTPKGE